jgi:hypothetical protein
MAGSVITIALAEAATHATRSSSAGWNIGPGLPILLALIVIGVVIYLTRQRRTRPPSSHDN